LFLLEWAPEGRRQAGAGPIDRRFTRRDPKTVLFRLVFAVEDYYWNGGIPMKSLALKLRRFLVSEDGPTAVEYAVMLALIIIVCLAAISTIGTKANTTFTNVGNSIK